MGHRGALLACAALASGCLHRRPDAHLIDQLDAEVAAVQEKNEILSKKLESCATPPGASEIFKQLQQVFSGTEVGVARAGLGARLIFPAEMLFPPNSLVVRQEAAMELDLLATALQLHPDAQVWIIGYATNGPTSGSLARAYPSAWEWSTAQAIAVMKALHMRYQVPYNRFGIGGRGAVDPVSNEETPEAQARNRRIEITLGPVDR